MKFTLFKLSRDEIYRIECSDCGNGINFKSGKFPTDKPFEISGPAAEFAAQHGKTGTERYNVLDAKRTWVGIVQKPLSESAWFYPASLTKEYEGRPVIGFTEGTILTVEQAPQRERYHI